MASCGYFFASLRQRSCSSQCRYRSVNAVTKMHCCSERKTAFVQPFCSARCSANKSLKQRCFNVFCIVRVILFLTESFYLISLKSCRSLNSLIWSPISTIPRVNMCTLMHSIIFVIKFYMCCINCWGRDGGTNPVVPFKIFWERKVSCYISLICIN